MAECKAHAKIMDDCRQFLIDYFGLRDAEGSDNLRDTLLLAKFAAQQRSYSWSIALPVPSKSCDESSSDSDIESV